MIPLVRVRRTKMTDKGKEGWVAVGPKMKNEEEDQDD